MISSLYKPTGDVSKVSRNKITCASEYGPVPSVFSNNGSSMNEVKYLRGSWDVREDARTNVDLQIMVKRK